MAQPLVTLGPPTVVATPGTDNAASVTVTNRGDVVDEISLDILGPAAAWSRLEPPVVRLFPGAQEVVRLVVAPAAGPAVPAGDVAFGVRARSAADGASYVVEGTITVTPLHILQYGLRPKRARGRRRARAAVELTNMGNAPVLARLTAPADDDEIDVILHRERVTVQPGAMRRVAVRVRPRRGRLVGQPVPRPYAVEITPDRGAPGRVDGTATQLPMVGRGAGVVALLVIAAVALVLVLRGMNTEPGSQASVGAPVSGNPAVSGSPAAGTPGSSSASGSGTSPSPTAQPRPGGTFHVLPATRILDTQTSSPIGANGSLDVAVLGAGGVPSSGVAAVVLDIIVTPTDFGFLAAGPSGQGAPAQPVIGYERSAGAWQWTTAGITVVPGSAGSVTLTNQSNGSARLRVDVEGWYTGTPDGTSGLFNPVSPVQLLDTRNGSGPIAANGCTDVAIGGGHGVPGHGVGAAVVSLTAINSGSAETFLQAFASGAPQPFPSLVGAVGQSSVTNQAIVPVGADGRIRICTTAAPSDLVVDLYGWFTDSSGAQTKGLLFVPAPLTVLCDPSKPGTQCSAMLSPGSNQQIQIVGGAVPPAAKAAVLGILVEHAAGSPGLLHIAPVGASMGPDPAAYPVICSWPDATGGNGLAVIGLGTGGSVVVTQSGPDTVTEQIALEGWFD